MADRLETALNGSRVAFTSETYAAKHGWTMPDFPVYDEAEAEHAWREMLAFFARTLKEPARG